MAVTLLQVLVLGVIAAAADDVPITWLSSPRASVPCVVPDADRIPARRPPPPLEADDRPRPKPYVWKKGDEEVKRVLSNGTLEVSRKKDGSTEGVYQCTVRHHAGLVLGYPVHLKFAYLDKQFSVHPENATAWLGQPFVLNCDINSGPAAAISWQRDGVPLPENNRYHLLKNQLLILDVTRDDAGLYRCKATNSQANRTKVSHGGRLQVEEFPGDVEPALLPVHQDSDIVVPKGEKLVLPCPLSGKPRPKLIWEFTPRGDRKRELEEVDEVLTITKIDPDQEGLYTCFVEGNSDLAKSFNVTITEPVVIIVPPSSKQAFRASTVRFNCTAVGRPAPTVTWYKDGQPLAVAGRIVVLPSIDGKRLQLLIRSVTSDDAGVYQCFAHNVASYASSWATLNVTGAGAPAPIGVRCAAAGARVVTVHWPKLEAEVMAYTVQINIPGGNSLPSQPVIGIEDVITVSEPLTPYGFQVRAYIKSSANRNIASDMSEIVTCQGQGVPLKLARQGDDIFVSWKQFANTTPGVKEWILQYKAENSTDEHNVTLPAEVTNHTLKASLEPLQVRVLGTKILPWLHQNLTLVPWTSTSIAILAPNGGVVKAIPEDVEVTDVGPQEITVRWRCEDADASLETYTYMVCTRKVNGNEDCIESPNKSARVVNLSPNTEYEVRVQARVPARMAVGEFSVPIHISTPSEGSQRFKDLSYKMVNATTLRVSWNSLPDKYTVQYSTELNMPINQWAYVDTMGNTVLLTGLDLTKELYVIVKGYEPVGHSPILTIPVQVAEAKELQYVFTGSGVQVSWRGEGPRVVRYSQNLTQSLDTWPTINVTTNTVHITGLEAERHTYVMVITPGPSSRSQVLTVPPRPPSEHSSFYLSVGIGCGLVILCLLAAAAVCIWRRRKRTQSPIRLRRRNMSSNEGNEEDGAEMKKMDSRLANGGGSKDAGEPLLNGHVHITENPNQSKTPNGRMRKGRRYEAAFDVARYEDPDSTLETVLDPDTSASTTFNLLDTSRRPEYDLSRSSRDLSANNSFNKLPDDNMNSEVTRSTDFQVDNSKILPTLQPNG